MQTQLPARASAGQVVQAQETPHGVEHGDFPTDLDVASLVLMVSHGNLVKIQLPALAAGGHIPRASVTPHTKQQVDWPALRAAASQRMYVVHRKEEHCSDVPVCYAAASSDLVGLSSRQTVAYVGLCEPLSCEQWKQIGKNVFARAKKHNVLNIA